MIELRDVTLDFPIGLHRSLKDNAQVGGEIIAKGWRKYARALSNVTLKISADEHVGVIGANGSGKSTLLRICAGIFQPTNGTVHVDGVVATLFTNSLGLSPNNTGRKNIALGLRFMGASPKDLDASIREMADFCKLGSYLELPVSTYSAGMKTRLAFAICTHIRPEIALIDEVVGAGDMQFIKSAKLRLESAMYGAKILLMATHSINVLEQFCERAIWIHRGKIVDDDSVSIVAKNYKDWVKKR